MSLTDVIGIPSVGLLIGAIGYWLRREISDMKKTMAGKVENNLCIEREHRIEDRLQTGDEAFKQIMVELKEQRAGDDRIKEMLEANQNQQQESIRLLGEALLEVYRSLGGNGSCERVEMLLNKISESRLGGA